MSALPPSLLQLIAALTRLPGIGPRSAERLALHLMLAEPDRTEQLARALLEARQRVQTCQQCGGLTEVDPCALCTDPRRDAGSLCVVERPTDILLIEKAGVFRGRYHVLGGKLSPLNGIEPEDLRIAALERRLETEPVQEVILALPTDVEGDATSHYLARCLQGRSVRVTRLAHGLPAGSGLEYADELTLSRALEGRAPLA